MVDKLYIIANINWSYQNPTANIMNYQTLSLTVKNQIAHLLLDREEKLNAINFDMFMELIAVIKLLKKDKSIRAVIISGKGNDFCSGLDVKSVLQTPSAGAKLLAKLRLWKANKAQYISSGWRELPVPVIIAMHGRCWGGGMQISLGADFRITTPDANISIMEAKWGLIPDMGGTLGLRELVSQDVAKELAMTAKNVSGEEAKTIGLVTHLADDPVKAAFEMAETIKKQNPDAVAAVKKLYNKSWWSSQGMVLARESWYQVCVLMSKNYRIKGYNQVNEKQREFLPRKKW